MLVKDLLKCNACYDPVVLTSGARQLRAIQTYSDFYSGGRHFESHKDLYLRVRPIEAQQVGTGVSNPYRQNRLACAYYTPHAGGIGDNLCGTGLQYPPSISVEGKEGKKDASQKSDKRTEYWTKLNQNCDGKGSNTRSIAWTQMQSLIIHKRAYLVVNFPDGSKDATFSALTAREVDDWQPDADGRAIWIRTHCIDLERSQAYGPQDIERHTWTFYEADKITECVAEKKIGEDWAADAVTKDTESIHGLGVLPVFPIEVEDNFWVMDRLFSTAHAYFNREASRAFAIDAGAHVQPVIKTNKDISSLITADGYAIKLSPSQEEDFFWRSPDGAIYGALKDDCDYLLNNLYSALNQMALNAAGQAGNPRQSGVAKLADAGAIKAFLSLLCSPIMAAWRNALRAVQDYRDENDLEIQCLGMSEFDVQSIELEINRAVTFLGIAGLPPEAQKQAKLKATRAYLSDISEESKQKIQQEANEIAIKPPEEKQAQQNNVGQNGAGMVNGTTGRPQGFGPSQVRQQFTKAAVGAPTTTVSATAN